MKIPKEDREFLVRFLSKCIERCGENCELCKRDRRLISKLKKNAEFSKEEVMNLAMRRSVTHTIEEINFIIQKWKRGKPILPADSGFWFIMLLFEGLYKKKNDNKN